jgi:hypothetical protein
MVSIMEELIPVYRLEIPMDREGMLNLRDML